MDIQPTVRRRRTHTELFNQTVINACQVLPWRSLSVSIVQTELSQQLVAFDLEPCDAFTGRLAGDPRHGPAGISQQFVGFGLESRYAFTGRLDRVGEPTKPSSFDRR